MTNGPAAGQFSPGPDCKLGAMKKKCGSGMKKWALRYLILDKPNRILYYYHTPKDASPRRSLDLSTCTLSRLTQDESPKEPGFKVTVPNVRDFVFVGNNAAIVDDWINALFQAKSPTGNNETTNTFTRRQQQQAVSPASSQMSSSPTSPQQQRPRPQLQPGSDNFSYNGPTLAVIPNRNSGLNNNPPPEAAPVARQGGTARSTQSTLSDGQSTNNTTLVGAGGDGNSTLVAGGGSNENRQGGQQLVPVIVLTSDNKKMGTIERNVVGILSIGRYIGGSTTTAENSITFKSKVISRHHAEIWTVNGEVYVRDSRSQSGTFLNAMRLSEPSRESKPYRLKPGDILQFGVDYKGATEDNARCISLRVDIKHKMVDVGQVKQMMSMRPSGTDEEGTLIVGSAGSSEEATTMVGSKTKSADRTLVGNQPAQPQFQQPMPRPGMQPTMRPQMVVGGRPQLMMGQPQVMRPQMVVPGGRPRPMGPGM